MVCSVAGDCVKVFTEKYYMFNFNAAYASSRWEFSINQSINQHINLINELHSVQVFTTVGTPAKVDFLLTRFPGLTRDHILHSRSTKFEQDIMNMTHSKGVNVVLNSLAGDKLQVRTCPSPMCMHERYTNMLCRNGRIINSDSEFRPSITLTVQQKITINSINYAL